MRTMPMYVSANLSRVPSISPGEVDIFALASTVAGLTEQVSVLLKRLETTEAKVATVLTGLNCLHRRSKCTMMPLF